MGDILDVLRDHDVKATFFVISDLIPGREDFLRRAVLEGHELANHYTSDCFCVQDNPEVKTLTP
jgi:peptidoglycan/xylan/chitin deacetylase (PgdA/CDA1 family)